MTDYRQWLIWWNSRADSIVWMGEGKRNAARFVCDAMNYMNCPTVMWGFLLVRGV